MYTFAQQTDMGIKRLTNQDSIITKEACVKGLGPIIMSAVCDGMGGLKDGDVASSVMVKHLEDWFDTPDLSKNTLCHLIYEESNLDFKDRLFTSLKVACDDASREIRKRSGGSRCGTTLAMLILFRQRAYYFNVGDSRVYVIRNQIRQLTHDQTVTQRKLDEGKITEAEALTDPERSTLWQCIGASPRIVPEQDSIICLPNDIYLLCSDGFRHKVSAEEMQRVILSGRTDTAEALSDKIGYLIEENKKRRESDNISAILIKCLPEV